MTFIFQLIFQRLQDIRLTFLIISDFYFSDNHSKYSDDKGCNGPPKRKALKLEIRLVCISLHNDNVYFKKYQKLLVLKKQGSRLVIIYLKIQFTICDNFCQ